jgi:Ca-activated chloride channel family protein
MANSLSGRTDGFSLFWTKQALVGCLLLVHPEGAAQTPPVSSPQGTGPYTLSVSVNEVEITFHAADAHNLPVFDLRPDEVDVFDNYHGPGQIISMRELNGRSIHAGFIVDTSGSVATQLVRARAEAQEAVEKLVMATTDEGTAIAFGRSRRVVQSWTNQKNSLVRSIGEIGSTAHDPIDGTSVYDTLLSTCLYEFGKDVGETAANVILLFSDGADTASHETMQAAIDRCRQNHTAIYAFSPKPVQGTTSSLGPETLRRLTEQTGGRLFYTDGPDGDIHADLDTVASDLRSEYFLLYRPKTLDHDGAFHRIVLVGPERVAEIVSTSGFYAPPR